MTVFLKSFTKSETSLLNRVVIWLLAHTINYNLLQSPQLVELYLIGYCNQMGRNFVISRVQIVFTSFYKNVSDDEKRKTALQGRLAQNENWQHWKVQCCYYATTCQECKLFKI